jgi:hypothetical protein
MPDLRPLTDQPPYPSMVLGGPPGSLVQVEEEVRGGAGSRDWHLQQLPCGQFGFWKLVTRSQVVGP